MMFGGRPGQRARRAGEDAAADRGADRAVAGCRTAGAQGASTCARSSRAASSFFLGELSVRQSPGRTPLQRRCSSWVIWDWRSPSPRCCASAADAPPSRGPAWAVLPVVVPMAVLFALGVQGQAELRSKLRETGGVGLLSDAIDRFAEDARREHAKDFYYVSRLGSRAAVRVPDRRRCGSIRCAGGEESARDAVRGPRA